MADRLIALLQGELVTCYSILQERSFFELNAFMERAQTNYGVPNAWLNVASLKDQSAPEARFKEAWEVCSRILSEKVKSSTLFSIANYIDCDPLPA